MRAGSLAPMYPKIGRNDPCPCGSGRKVKKCHIDQVSGSGPSPERPRVARRLNVSLMERNDLFLDAIDDIFALGEVRSWDEVKHRVTPETVRELYQAHNAIWATDDVDSLLPPKIEGLTSLFLGKIDAEELTQRVFRFGLYTDQILVPNPFTFPAPAGRHPLEAPQGYIRDTLKLLYFVLRLAPWIRSGYVQLIGDPMHYQPEFRAATIKTAGARLKALGGLDPRDLDGMDGDNSKLVQRMFGYLPSSHLDPIIRKMMPSLDDEERAQLIVTLQQRNARDPLGLLPLAEGQGPLNEMMIERYGTPLEAALYICDRTGAFPFTESHTKWRELLSAKADLSESAQTWTPLTKAFQELDFHFLDNVDSQFAARLREEDRLAGFRTFLRDLWGKIGGSADSVRAESLAREYAQRLAEEHRRAEEEWKKIGREAAAGAVPDFVTAAGGTALIVGGLLLSGNALAATLAGLTATLTKLGTSVVRSGQKRQEFRVSTPMSVFVDLKRHRKTKGRL